MPGIRPETSPVPSGLADIVLALRRGRTWLMPAWYDFVIEHRRTLLGPFWETVQAGVWVLGLWAIFALTLSKTDAHYLAYVAVGMVFWNLISSNISGGSRVFVSKANLIQNINIPLFTHVLRQITETLVEFLFQSPVIVMALVVDRVSVDLVTLLAIPGFLMIVLTAFWVVPLVGIIATRYRDASYAIGSMLRFMFFVSPVFWRPDGLGERAFLAHFNPVTHYLEIVRAPLLGSVPSVTSWYVVFGITAAGLAVTLFAFHQVRTRIVFWL